MPLKNYPTDINFIYSLNEKQIHKWKNNWFSGKNVIKENLAIIEQLWTIKEVDDRTSIFLYGKKYNPISISIFRENEGEHTMIVTIHSIVESNYSSWFNGILKDLINVKEKIINWINEKELVNGEEFLYFCEEIGAKEINKNG